MTRVLAFCAAVILSAITVSSACIATPVAPLNFRLSADGGSRVQLSLLHDDRRHNSVNSSSYAAADLPGLDVAALRQTVQRQVRFALVREAGRVDCAGIGGSASAAGHCIFTPDPAFAAFLDSRGIGRPTAEQSFDLAMVGASRDLVDALAANHYPRGDIEKLTELAAVGVDRRFVTDFATRGHAPATLDDLVEFAALNISPAYIDSLAEAGYRNLSADQIAQLGGAPHHARFHPGLRADRLCQPSRRDARRAEGAGCHACFRPQPGAARHPPRFRRKARGAQGCRHPRPQVAASTSPFMQRRRPCPASSSSSLRSASPSSRSRRRASQARPIGERPRPAGRLRQAAKPWRRLGRRPWCRRA